MNFRRLLKISFLSLVLTGAATTGAMGDTPQKADATAGKPARESSAWTLSSPLGDHLPSDVDTLLYNYQRRSIPSMVSDAYATTGNLGAEGINMIFSRRPATSQFFFTDALDAWTTTQRNQKLYNVYTPMTLLSYNFAGNKQNHTDRLKGEFAGNVNRRIGVSAFLDYLYSKGCYESQATKDFSWGAAVYYLGDRYEMQTLYNNFNFLNKENGGITDPLYITDPALVQGGVDKIEPKSIPTRLTAAHNRVTGTEVFSTHAFKVGFWKDEQVNDTLTRQVYVPVTKFVYSIKYEGRHRFFLNTDAQQARDFWKNTYFNPDRTDDDTRYWALTNSVGIQMMEGFQKWARFGLGVYASYQLRRFTLPSYHYGPGIDIPDPDILTPLPQNVHIEPRVTQNLLWVGGRLAKTRGSILLYEADARFGLVGDAAGEIDVKGNISTRFRLFGDTVAIKANARFSNLSPSWLMRNYSSNHFIWHNDFGKIRTFHAGGELTIPWTRTTISADVDNIQNYVYFGPDGLPRQHGGNIQVITARLDQRLHFGIWNWNNTLTYQATTDTNVIPLPALSV